MAPSPHLIPHVAPPLLQQHGRGAVSRWVGPTAGRTHATQAGEWGLWRVGPTRLAAATQAGGWHLWRVAPTRRATATRAAEGSGMSLRLR